MENTSKKIISILIFGAICLVFALFGLPVSDLGGGSGNAYVAIVNDSFIPVRDFQMEVAQMEQMYSQFFGSQMSGQMGYLRTQAVENLINREILAQESEKNHIYSTDNEVRDFIVGIPGFQDKGRFQRDRYDNYLRQSGRTASEFEVAIKKDLVGERLRTLFSLALEPTSGILGKERELGSTKLSLEFIKITLTELEEKEQLKKTTSEVDAWAGSHGKEINDYYTQNSNKYNKDEEVRARHILVNSKKGDEAAALKKIKEIAKEIKGGNFGDLAKKYSDDPGSKEKGGDLGFFTQGRMVPEFDKAAFSLPLNQISDPIKTEYGYHLIEVLEKKAKATTPLDQVKSEIARRLLTHEQVKESFVDFKNLVAAKNLAGIEAWAKARKISWETTGSFSLSDYAIPKMGSFDDFSDILSTLTKSSPLSNRLVSSGGAEFLVKLKDIDVGSEPKPETEMATKDLSRSRGQGVMAEWVKRARKMSSVKTNQRVVRDSSEEG